jgi:DNA-binding HxlR family transcriptional regulator
VNWDQVGDQICSVARTMSILGDRWTMLVVREAFAGTTLFDEFVAYTGATPQVISERLKRLVEAGIFETRAKDKGRGSEYVMTEMGRDLHPIISTIIVFGDKWLSDGKGPPQVTRHVGCGCVTAPRLACSECSEFVSPANLTREPSPAMQRYRARMLTAASK